MENKKNWNLRVFPSVADAIDALADAEYREDKGLVVNAALLYFLALPPSDQQRAVDLIKIAEARGSLGTIRDAFIALLQADTRVEAQADALFRASEDDARARRPSAAPRSKPPPKAGSSGAA